MAKIMVEIEVPDGDECFGCQFFENMNWCPIFNERRTLEKLPECIAATVEENG